MGVFRLSVYRNDCCCGVRSRKIFEWRLLAAVPKRGMLSRWSMESHEVRKAGESHIAPR